MTEPCLQIKQYVDLPCSTRTVLLRNMFIQSMNRHAVWWLTFALWVVSSRLDFKFIFIVITPVTNNIVDVFFKCILQSFLPCSLGYFRTTTPEMCNDFLGDVFHGNQVHFPAQVWQVGVPLRGSAEGSLREHFLSNVALGRRPERLITMH